MTFSTPPPIARHDNIISARSHFPKSKRAAMEPFFAEQLLSFLGTVAQM
jgi:hypothetical protein